MTSTARQLRQPPTIEAIERVPYFADVIKPSRCLFSKEYKLYSERIRQINLNALVKKLLPNIGGTT